MDAVDALMRQAIEKGVFPGAALLVAREGIIEFFDAYGYTNIFTRQAVTTDTVFDLASLTKPLATTPALMVLNQQHKLALDQPIGSILQWLQGTDKEAITIKALLNHSGGLPAYSPFYTQLSRLPFEERKTALQKALAKIPREHSIGEFVLYSDLGFMLLNFLVQKISGKRLDRISAEEIYKPLGISNRSEPRLCFVDLHKPIHFENVAATEICQWRRCLIEGVVHDDNAYAMGGIAGHAGLFGDASGVFVMAQALLQAYAGSDSAELFQTRLVRRYFSRETPGARALGFDVPAQRNSSSGRYFSANSVGHLGFTGTSLWMDLDKAVIIILLTNRIHPSRSNERIKAFRPELHDAAMKVILKCD
jgi:CubicO group peptidase (beta-lactamase class C family)